MKQPHFSSIEAMRAVRTEMTPDAWLASSYSDTWMKELPDSDIAVFHVYPIAGTPEAFIIAHEDGGQFRHDWSFMSPSFKTLGLAEAALYHEFVELVSV